MHRFICEVLCRVAVPCPASAGGLDGEQVSLPDAVPDAVQVSLPDAVQDAVQVSLPGAVPDAVQVSLPDAAAATV